MLASIPYHLAATSSDPTIVMRQIEALHASNSLADVTSDQTLTSLHPTLGLSHEADISIALQSDPESTRKYLEMFKQVTPDARYYSLKADPDLRIGSSCTPVSGDHGTCTTVINDNSPDHLIWNRTTSTEPFPREHIPMCHKYLERNDECAKMPLGSQPYKEKLEFAFNQFLEIGPRNIDMETFGQLLSNIAGCGDGSLEHTDVFKTLIGEETKYDRRTQNKTTSDPLDPEHAKFIGIAPYPVQSDNKDFFLQEECTGHFETWREHIWDEMTNRPKGGLAARGPQAMRRSLNYQLRKKLAMRRNYTPAHVEEFARGQASCIWDGTQKLSNYMKKIFMGINATKGPAWGKIASNCTTKGEWISNPDNVLGIYYRIFLLVATDHTLLANSTPEDLFHAGLISPTELFPKDEIHKLSKIDTHRSRLIWNVSIQAEIIMRFFHNAQNKMEIELFQAGYTHSLAFPYFGSAVGMGHHDEGIDEVAEAMENLLSDTPGDPHIAPDGTKTYTRTHNGVATDPKAWDVSVTRALWICDGFRRSECARYGGAPFGFCYGLMNLALASSAHVIVLGKEMFALFHFGIMPSGCPSTSPSNSHMRCIAASEPYWVLYQQVGISLSMGDDNHSRHRAEAMFCELWAELGLQIDGGDTTLGLDDEIDFTSHLYDLHSHTAVFNNGEKLLLRLAYAGVHAITCEMSTGIRFAVRNTPWLRVLVDEFIRSAHPEWLDVDLTGPMDFHTVF
jgi:hypothetical protein